MTRAGSAKIAQELGLRVADKPDSQDICFVPDGDYASYIREHTGQRKRSAGELRPCGRYGGGAAIRASSTTR